MKAKKILKASSVNELRTYGSYFELKSIIENAIDNKLGVNGWESFFSKIQNLKMTVSSNKNHLNIVCQKNTLKDSKKEISKLLEIKFKAKDCNELNKKVDQLIILFCQSVFDPYKYYEQKKLKKFKDSSKLEGINITIPDKNISLDSVLAKYRR